MPMPDGAQEVKRLQEVPRTAECCGRPMRALSSVTTGGHTSKTWYCDRCGKQITREQA